jgi:gas vesicle protein
LPRAAFSHARRLSTPKSEEQKEVSRSAANGESDEQKFRSIAKEELRPLLKELGALRGELKDIMKCVRQEPEERVRRRIREAEQRVRQRAKKRVRQKAEKGARQSVQEARERFRRRAKKRVRQKAEKGVRRMIREVEERTLRAVDRLRQEMQDAVERSSTKTSNEIYDVRYDLKTKIEAQSIDVSDKIREEVKDAIDEQLEDARKEVWGDALEAWKEDIEATLIDRVKRAIRKAFSTLEEE